METFSCIYISQVLFLTLELDKSMTNQAKYKETISVYQTNINRCPNTNSLLEQCVLVTGQLL